VSAWQNRINRLIIEEERAAKRIEETRRRTQEIMVLKSRNVASQSAQRDAGEWVASEQVVQKQLMQQTREERRRNVAISRENAERLRRDEVRPCPTAAGSQAVRHVTHAHIAPARLCPQAAALKLAKRENEDAVTTHRNEEHARCVARKQFVLEQQRAAQERKAQDRQTALFRVREQREAKREQVYDDTTTQLHKFAALAEEERRLVESLQGWRSEQQQAFSRLETVLVRNSGAR